MTLLYCGHEPSPHGEHTTGTAQYLVSNGDGINIPRDICWECAAMIDLGFMTRMGRIALYYAQGKVSNWPDTLSFKPFNVRKGKHNIARTRTDVWFVGLDGYVWHGVNIGEFTQILHCKRTKQIWGKHGA